jgi:general secretion pathway protein D
VLAYPRGGSVLAILAVAIAVSACGNSLRLENPPLLQPSAASTNSQLKPWQDIRSRTNPDRPIGTGRSPDELFAGVDERGSGAFVAAKRDVVIIPERTATGQDGVTMNLVGVPIAQAAKFVLGDVMKANYTVADKIVGTVTIQTTTPVRRDAIIDIFESVLRANGAALLRAEGHYKIVPLASAAQGGAKVSLSGRVEKGGAQVLVVPLKAIAAAEMKRILDPISPQGIVLKIDENRNLLVLMGSAAELADAQSLVGVFDVDWMKGMSVALFPVKSSDPEPIAKELETVLGLDRDGPLKGVLRVIPNRRLGSIMVISSRPEPIDQARNWINKLDKFAENSEEQLFVYKIKNRNASELAGLLSRVLSSKEHQSANDMGQTIAPRFEPTVAQTEPTVEPRMQQGANRAASSNFSSTGSGSSPPAATTTPAPLTDRLPTPMATAPNSAATGQKVVADESNNALLITATHRQYQRILQILQRMDTLPTQVMLEAMIAEVTLNDELKFGLKWFFEKSNSQVTLSDAISGAVRPVFPGFSYFLAAKNISVALDAVSGITKVNVVSAPSLMVLDNRKATLQIGDQVPIVTQQAQNTTTVGGPVINSVTMKDTGVILNVTPRVSESGRVVLDIEQEVSNVARTTSSGIDSPTIQQRRIRTTVVVSDGEVVALGGLIQERDNVSKTQVPILGDVPVVGALFRQKTDRIDRTELLIFIKPQVVRDTAEARGVTDEFRQRIHLEPLTTQRGRNKYDRDAGRILR